MNFNTGNNNMKNHNKQSNSKGITAMMISLKNTSRIKSVITVACIVFLVSGYSVPAQASTATAVQSSAKQSFISQTIETTKHLAKKGAALAHEAYLTTVKTRAVNRAGNCNNINGHILEVMNGDKTNLNPFNGLQEKMVKSPVAKSVDAVVMKDNKIVQRVQYKDTAESISDTIRKVKSGQYNSTTIKGTTETANKFNEYAQKNGLNKRIGDTGISSDTTKMLAKGVGQAKQFSMLKAVKAATKIGAASGAAVTGIVSTATNVIEVSVGEKTAKEAVRDVALDTTGGAIAGASATAVSTLVGPAVATGVAAVGLTGAAATCVTVAAPVAVAAVTAVGVSYAWDKVCDKIKDNNENKDEEPKEK